MPRQPNLNRYREESKATKTGNQLDVDDEDDDDERDDSDDNNVQAVDKDDGSMPSDEDDDMDLEMHKKKRAKKVSPALSSRGNKRKTSPNNHPKSVPTHPPTKKKNPPPNSDADNNHNHKTSQTQSPRNSPRRRRTSTTPKSTSRSGSGNSRLRDRPAAPRAPPLPLVKLLQSNRAVLEYFKSLQANLEADVQIWKNRAQQYKQQLEELQQQQQPPNPRQTNDHKKKNHSQATSGVAAEAEILNRSHNGPSTRSDDDDPLDNAAMVEEIEYSPAQRHRDDENDHHGDEEGVPIDDSMLDFDTDDDESKVGGDPEALSFCNEQQKENTSRNYDHWKDTEPRKSNQQQTHQGDGEDTQPTLVDHPEVKSPTTAHDAAATMAEAQLQQQMQAVLALESSSEDDDDGDGNNKHGSGEDGVKKKAIAIKKRRLPAMPGFFALESSSDDDEEGSIYASNEMGKQNKETKMSSLESSADDDDDDYHTDDGEMQKDRDRETSTCEIPEGLDIDAPPFDDEYSHVLSLLCEAFKSLEMLGVKLVEEKVASPPPALPPAEATGEEKVENMIFEQKNVVDDDPMADCDQQSHESEKQNVEGKSYWIPRSDDDVAADLFWSIHSLSRLQLLDKEFLDRYPPFVTQELIPSCNYSDSERATNNPIFKGKGLAFRALLIMDTYGGNEQLFDHKIMSVDSQGREDTELKKIAIGFKGRQQLVRSLFSSLHGEITQSWSEQDRLDSFNTIGFHNESLMDRSRHEDSNAGHKDTTNAEKSHLMDAKIQGRLSSLVERAVLVQWLVGYYISCDDPDQVADLVWQYLLSTAPTQNDDHPKLPPVTSLVLLESMLVLQPNTVWWIHHDDGKPCTTSLQMLFYGDELTNPVVQWAEKALKLCIHLVASIWKEREVTALNGRIRDLARVEVAAYKRLVRAGIVDSDETTHFDDWKTRALSFCDEAQSHSNSSLLINRSPGGGEGFSRAGLLSYQLCLILGHVGTASDLIEVSSASAADSLLIARGLAYTEIEKRTLEKHRALVGSDVSMSTPFELPLNDTFLLSSSKESNSTSALNTAAILLQVATIVGNAKATLRYVHDILELVEARDISDENKASSISLLAELSQVPVVRVINLRCRPDRMKAFHVQAMVHGLTTVHAVATFQEYDGDHDHHPVRGTRPLKDANNGDDGDKNTDFYFGQYASDGRGKWSEATERLAKQFGGNRRLDSIVDTHWRPHDLKAFDTNAPDGERLVRCSPSERACAVSHIGSWKGALRSFRCIRDVAAAGATLTTTGTTMTTPPSSLVVRRPEVLKRLFHVSGFAQGVALQPSNRNNPPTPVCLILEDDAILVDRFTDRLQDLLQELPRDFHFCSLGYSRPKMAPIVSYRKTKHVGIPTNLFYLTGYLLSEAGADFLLNNLPVRGPVDSWIGLQMTNNFDNVFGTIVGVGTSSKPLAESLSNKDLCTILKFRAFCALQPLCAQRVGIPTATIPSSTGGRGGGRSHQSHTEQRSWRQRDTDIEYSGGKWKYNVGQS